MSLHLTVVVPAHNEARRIGRSLARLQEVLSGSGIDFEVIVVDDGSSDGTAGVASGFADSGRVRVERLARNQGKGAAIRAGIAAARPGGVIVTTDADLPYGAEAVLRCYDVLADGAALALGDRTLPGSRRLAPVGVRRRLLGRVYRAFVGALLSLDGVRDVQCGIKGFSDALGHEVARRSRVDGFGFDLELILIALERRARIERFPVTLVNNEGSSFHMLLDSFAMLRDAIGIARRRRAGQYGGGALAAAWRPAQPRVSRIAQRQ